MSPAEEAARAFLAEPAIAKQIREAIRAHVEAKLRIIDRNVRLNYPAKERVADRLEDRALERMRWAMTAIAQVHRDCGRTEAEKMLAFLLPLLRAPEVPPCQ